MTELKPCPYSIGRNDKATKIYEPYMEQAIEAWNRRANEK